MECKEYGKKNENINWQDIYKNDPENQYEIAQEVQKRLKIRDLKLEAGLDSLPGSQAPTVFVVE